MRLARREKQPARFKSDVTSAADAIASAICRQHSGSADVPCWGDSAHALSLPMIVAVRQLLGILGLLGTLLGSLVPVHPCGIQSTAAGGHDMSAMGMDDAQSSTETRAHGNHASDEALGHDIQRLVNEHSENPTAPRRVPSPACPAAGHCVTCAPVPGDVKVMSVASSAAPPPQARVLTPRDPSQEPPRRPPKA